VTRQARVRLAAVAGGLVLLAGPRIAPALPPAWVLPLSAVWLAVLGGLLVLAHRVLRALTGRVAATALLAAAAAALMGVTGTDWSGTAGVTLPCRRDWGWLPSYLLRSSPTRALDFTVGDRPARLCYGQPAARGRRMLGGPNVPYGQLWRTGANEPTTLRLTGPVVIAGIPVPAGNVSLYTVPGPETWEIIVNDATTQWGIESAYTPEVQARELGRAVVRADTADRHVERLLFRAEPARGDTVTLILSWERTRVRVPVRPAPDVGATRDD
jgi:hypothetical protein